MVTQILLNTITNFKTFSQQRGFTLSILSMDFNFDFETSDQTGDEHRHRDENTTENTTEPQLMEIVATQRTVDPEYDFVIHHEDDTLAAIIHEQLLCDDNIAFVGYRKDHKLDNHIRITVKLDKRKISENTNPSEIVIGCLRQAAQKAINSCIELRNTLPNMTFKQRDVPNFGNENLENIESQSSQLTFDFLTSDLIL